MRLRKAVCSFVMRESYLKSNNMSEGEFELKPVKRRRLLTRDKQLFSTVRAIRHSGGNQFADFESALESRLHHSSAMLVRMDISIPL